MRRLTGIRDFAGRAIYEGDRIIHPLGETGIVVYDETFPETPWRVRYDHLSDRTSALILQVGDRGQAIVSNPPCCPSEEHY